MLLPLLLFIIPGLGHHYHHHCHQLCPRCHPRLNQSSSWWDRSLFCLLSSVQSSLSLHSALHCTVPISAHRWLPSAMMMIDRRSPFLLSLLDFFPVESSFSCRCFVSLFLPADCLHRSFCIIIPSVAAASAAVLDRFELLLLQLLLLFLVNLAVFVHHQFN